MTGVLRFGTEVKWGRIALVCAVLVALFCFWFAASRTAAAVRAERRAVAWEATATEYAKDLRACQGDFDRLLKRLELPPTPEPEIRR